MFLLCFNVLFLLRSCEQPEPFIVFNFVGRTDPVVKALFFFLLVFFKAAKLEKKKVKKRGI